MREDPLILAMRCKTRQTVSSRRDDGPKEEFLAKPKDASDAAGSAERPMLRREKWPNRVAEADQLSNGPFKPSAEAQTAGRE